MLFYEAARKGHAGLPALGAFPKVSSANFRQIDVAGMES
jgi:hypothetical protein